MRRMLSTIAFLATASTAARAQGAPPAAGPSDAQLITLGRQLTDWWYMGQTDSIYAHMTTEAAGKMPKDEFMNQRDQILSHIGSETAVVEDKMTLRKGNRQYWRESKVETMPETIVVRWVFDSTGNVIGLGINPKSKAPDPDPS